MRRDKTVGIAAVLMVHWGARQKKIQIGRTHSMGALTILRGLFST